MLEATMPYRFLADLTIIVHLGFILFVVLGGLVVLKWRWIAFFHLPAAVWGALIEFCGTVCPLTHLENYLRRRSGAAGYDTGFIEHYIVPVVYPSGLTRGMQIFLGAVVLVVNIAVYVILLFRSRRK
jgi:hypothetical protein